MRLGVAWQHASQQGGSEVWKHEVWNVIFFIFGGGQFFVQDQVMLKFLISLCISSLNTCMTVPIYNDNCKPA